MDYIFRVSFHGQGKLQYFLANYLLNQGDLVICETINGIELGRITSKPKEYQIVENEEIPFSYILREANEEDVQVFEKNKQIAQDAFKIIQSEADKLNLSMKITSTEFTLDQTKLIVSFLSEERVDFRDLLKVLASLYHCRIELRQIGPRDKAKMIGGIGICGLPLCCSTFLNEFDGISITMAKNQMLALNIPKLSGQCGKLICCLKYEDDVYSLERADLPKIGLRVKYENQIYRISSINILTKMVRIENPDNILTVPLSSIENNIMENYNPTQPMKRYTQAVDKNDNQNKTNRPPFKKHFKKNKGQNNEEN